MHRSARTATPMAHSRSGSSTMQSATGQAAWQIEHANAPKQRSGSITAMVLGAFLRGPLIILVHIVGRLYRRPRMALLEHVSGGWLPHFGHGREERGCILEDHPVRVGRKVSGVVDRVIWIGSRLERRSRRANGESVAGSGRSRKRGGAHLDGVIRTVDRVGACQARGEKRRIAPDRQRAKPREARRIEAGAAGQGECQLGAIYSTH